MQVPEKLSLIGGSILLASTLVFTLKSQASDVIPKVNDGMSEMFKSDNERQQEQNENEQRQLEQNFNNGFQQAQQKGEQTGYWGTAKFYVDNQDTMHVGSGQLSGSFSQVANDEYIKTISLDGAVKAPQDSSYLFGHSSSLLTALANINNLNRLDTSQATNMYGMFNEDFSLNNLDLSHFDTHNVTNMGSMFNGNSRLNSLDLNSFNTASVTDMSNMFNSDDVLYQLNLNNFNTSNVKDMSSMFAGMNISNLDLNSFNTSSVTNMSSMFNADIVLRDLNINNFNTNNVTDMSNMFNDDEFLNGLNMSHFNTSNVNNMKGMFNGSNAQQLNLGINTKLNNDVSLSSTYKNGNQTLNPDGSAKPGTWINQHQYI